MVDLAERLERATSRLELEPTEIARLLEANPRTVTRWLQRAATPRPDARERLLEFIAVLEHLSAVLRPEPAHDWLFTPNGLLDHHKPVDLLRRGEYRKPCSDQPLGEGVFT